MKKEFLSLLEDKYLRYYETAEKIFNEKAYLGSLYYYKIILEEILLELYKEEKPTKTALDYFLKDSLELKVTNISNNLPDLKIYNIDNIFKKIDTPQNEDEAKTLSLSLKYIINEILIYKVEKNNKIKREKNFQEELGKLKEV